MSEKQMNINVMDGGFVVYTANGESPSQAKIYTSPAKLIKAVRDFISDDTNAKAETPAE